MTSILDGWLLREKRDRPSRIENRFVDFVERRKALLVRRGLELAAGDELVLQPVHANGAVLNQDVGVAFDDAVESFVSVEKPDDDVVDGEQRGSADDAARDAVVLANDRVLHGVRE